MIADLDPFYTLKAHLFLVNYAYAILPWALARYSCNGNVSSHMAGAHRMVQSNQLVTLKS
jgi:hypothetical protein